MNAKRLQVNGHEYSMESFIVNNDLSEVEVEALESMEVGEFAVFGGGAFEEFTVTRTA